MKRDYIFPAVEIFSVNVERGFADSFGASINDYTKNESDSMDD